MLTGHTKTESMLDSARGNLYCASLSRVRLFVIPWTVARHVLSMGILQARILEWAAMPSSKGSSQPRELRPPALQVNSLPSEPPGKPNLMTIPVSSSVEIKIATVQQFVFDCEVISPEDRCHPKEQMQKNNPRYDQRQKQEKIRTASLFLPPPPQTPLLHL